MRLSFALALVSLSVTSTSSDAFVVLTRYESSYSYGTIFDLKSQKVLTAGVSFRGVYQDVTLEGQSDTDCMIAVGDILGYDRKLFESPQMCMYPTLFAGETPGLPQAIVFGFDGSRGTVFSLDFFREYDESEISNPINLPFETYPVASSTDPLGGVYVGMHPTSGQRLKPSGQEGSTELKNVLEYVDKMTRPLMSEVQSPQIMKFNVTSGAVVWGQTLTTTGGRSTVGAIKYMVSRDILVVVGSSNGEGSYVGAGVSSTGDWDGFLTIIDAKTGHIDDSAANKTHLTADHSLRIQSQPNQNDFVLGLCILDDKVFLVGSTDGVIDGKKKGGGFVMKIDIDTFNVLWKRQFVGDGVEITHCTGFSSVLYVGGQVPPGVRVDDPTRTHTSDTQDLILAHVNADTGEPVWIRQVDSRREDRLTGFIISGPGNLIFIGNAFDLETGTNRGYTNSILLQTGFHDWQMVPPGTDPLAQSIFSGEEDPASFKEDDSSAKIIALSVVIPVVVLLLVVILYSYMSSNSKPKNDSPNISKDGAGQKSGEMTPPEAVEAHRHKDLVTGLV